MAGGQPGAPEPGDVFLDFAVETARGKTTKFNLKADPDVIRRLIKEYRGPANTGRFAQTTPTPGAAVQAMTPGANYVGAVPQTFNPAIPATGEPLRRGNILREFIAGIGIPLYQGRIKARSKMLGFFRPSVHEVRIRNANDLETTAHEMAHYLDRVIPEIASSGSRQPTPMQPSVQSWPASVTTRRSSTRASPSLSAYS